MNNTENPIQKAVWLGTGPLADAPDFDDRVFSELEATIKYHRWDELRPEMDRMVNGDAAAKLMLGAINVLTCRIMRGEQDLSHYLITETAAETQEPLPSVVSRVSRGYLDRTIGKDEAIKTLTCATQIYRGALNTLKNNGYNASPKRPHDEGRYVGVAPTNR